MNLKLINNYTYLGTAIELFLPECFPPHRPANYLNTNYTTVTTLVSTFTVVTGGIVGTTEAPGSKRHFRPI